MKEIEMNEAKYTPGPWKACKQFPHQSFIEIEHGDKHTPGAASLVIARVTCRPTWQEEQEANARLIAVAPEMLKELKNSTEMLENIMNNRDWGSIEEQICDNHEIIAKATGK